MSNYAEEYDIAGMNYAIEDFEAPGPHFQLDRQSKRFLCWLSGSAIGNATNLREAHTMIRHHCQEKLRYRISQAEDQLRKDKDALGALRNPVSGGLKRFRVDQKGG